MNNSNKNEDFSFSYVAPVKYFADISLQEVWNLYLALFLEEGLMIVSISWNIVTFLGCCKIVKSDCYVRHVCLSVWLFIHMEQLGSHGTDFHNIWFLSIFWKSVEQIQVSLKSDKNKGCFTWRPTYIFCHILLSSSYNEKCLRQKL
jgi:hypothetical protein